MALVYRVEDQNHHGPYHNTHYESLMSCCRVIRRHINIKHPTPREDSYINRYMEDYERCGFKDLQQFRDWFNLRDRRLLHSLGFILAVYDAKEIKLGEYQVIFDKRGAHKIQEYSILTKKRY
jgi:hypothetical protein